MTRVVGEYVLGRQLGAGGMATVFQATHRATGALRALKLVDLRGGDMARDLARFTREAQALAKVDAHPHVLRVHECGQLPPGQAYCVLEWIDGRDLSERLKEGPLPLPELLATLTPIADALAHCHARGIVHRDLKPANVLLRHDGHPFLSDFGVAHNLVEARITQTQGLVGTPDYMSPEQCRGDGSPVGPASDVFAFGLLLHEAAVGRLPFAVGSPFAVLAQRVQDAPIPIDSSAPGLTRDLTTLIRACVSVDPQQRPSARTCVRALRALSDGQPSPLVPRPARARWVVAAAVSLSALVGGAWALQPEPVLDPAPVVEAEADWVEAAVRGRRFELERTTAIARALGDPDRPLENVFARLRAQDGGAAGWGRVALRLCVEAGAPWPDDVPLAQLPSETQALISTCRALGWLGGRADAVAALRASADLGPEGSSLREALEGIEAETQRRATQQRAAVARCAPGWATVAAAPAPEPLRAFAEDLARRRSAAAIEAGFADAFAAWSSAPPDWTHPQTYTDLRAYLRALLAAPAELSFSAFAETLTRSLLEACAGRGDMETTTELARAGVDALSVLTGRLDWAQPGLRRGVLELFDIGHFAGNARLSSTTAQLYLDATVWVDTKRLAGALESWQAVQLRAGTSDVPLELLLIGVVGSRNLSSEVACRHGVEALSAALGDALGAEEREGLGLPPVRPVAGALRLEHRLLARRLLGTLRLLDASPTVSAATRGAAARFLLQDLPRAEQALGFSLWMDHLAQVCDTLGNGVRDGFLSRAPWAERSATVAREGLERLLERFRSLPARERARPERLAAATGHFSLVDFSMAARRLSAEVLRHWSDEVALEEFANSHNALRAQSGLACDRQLQLWLVERYHAAGAMQRALAASEAILDPSGPVMPEERVQFEAARARCRLVRALIFEELGQVEEARVELGRYRPPDGPTRDYQALCERLGVEPQ